MAIHSLLSDAELDKEFIAGLRRRNLDQKFFYMREGADLFYNVVHTKITRDEKLILHSDDVANSFHQANSKPPSNLDQEEQDLLVQFMKDRSYRKYPTAFVSLGCGDANKEKPLLQFLETNYPDIPYLGIDSSYRMLELAQENLTGIKLEKDFLFADLTNKECKQYVDDQTQDYKIRILAFLGGTFGNPNQTEIANAIHKFMLDGDLLWVDMQTREEISTESEDLLEQKALSRLSNETLQASNLLPLRQIGLPSHVGSVKLAIGSEDHVGAKLFKFYFQFTEKVTLNKDGDSLIFLPGEIITLQHMRVYHRPTFLKFMDEMGFFLLDELSGPRRHGIARSHFLFRKKLDDD